MGIDPWTSGRLTDGDRWRQPSACKPPRGSCSRVDIQPIRYTTRNPLLKRKAPECEQFGQFADSGEESARPARHEDCDLSKEPMVQLRACRFLPLVAAAVVLHVRPAAAQTAPPDPIPVAGPIPEEIDLNLINLPTTKSLVRNKGYFRLTHRFAADLRRGSFGELASDLFTIDRGAIIGLE